jgi:hypothetical protein
MPAGAVHIGRGSRWANPARVGRWASAGPEWRDGERCTASKDSLTQAETVLFYRLGLKHGGIVATDHLGHRHACALPTLDMITSKLAGKCLVCWCALDQPCHGDVLLKIANGGAP